MHSVSSKLRPFGETIFTTISALAQKHGAVNLGQGFPDFDGPDFVKQAAVDAIRAGHSQYARMFGIPALNQAIAERFFGRSGMEIDPQREVTVTSGCTEAIAAALLGILEPGDEVILIEPSYDSYRASVAMAGATAKFVRLRPPEFRLDPADVAAAITRRTRCVLLNTPHNPTGRVLDGDELAAVASLAQRHDLIVLSDEVYERLVFEGEHRSIAALPGMRERTLTLSSLGKTFSLTGWKVGWSIGPEHLTSAVRAAHQFLTFSTATPLQHAAVAALHADEGYYAELLEEYRQRRQILLDGLSAAGLKAFVPQGAYFVIAECASVGFSDDEEFCRHLIEKVGVAAIPVSAFLHDRRHCRTLVRFAFCKREETLREAVRRLRERLGG
jgi:aspartate/methionine/tyrosine aminotransferase